MPQNLIKNKVTVNTLDQPYNADKYIGEPMTYVTEELILHDLRTILNDRKLTGDYSLLEDELKKLRNFLAQIRAAPIRYRKERIRR